MAVPRVRTRVIIAVFALLASLCVLQLLDFGTESAHPSFADPAPDTHDHCVVRGRCVDERGIPLAGVTAELHAWYANHDRADRWLRWHDDPGWQDLIVQTSGDGAFEFRFWPPPPMQFSLQLVHDKRSGVQGRWGEIAEGAHIDLGNVTMPTGCRVAGRLRDTAGKPVLSMRLRFSFARSGLEIKPAGTAARTDSGGTFVCPDRFAPGTYRVRTTQSNHWLQPAFITIPPGREQIEFELSIPVRSTTTSPHTNDEAGAARQPESDVGRDLEVVVVTTDGRAVESQIQIRVVPLHDIPNESRVRCRGRFPNGRAIVPRVASGSYRILVEPRDPQLGISLPVPLVVDEEPNPRVTISLPRAANPVVRVQLADGTPVPGSVVHSVQTLGQRADLSQQIRTWHGLFALDRGITNAGGEVRTRGPARAGVALFVLGPGHTPTVLPNVDLSADDPLVVTVREGARITGKLTPTAAVRDLESLGESLTQAARRLRVSLRRPSSGRFGYEEFPAGEVDDIRCTVDGAFRITGAPAGQWSVHVEWVHGSSIPSAKIGELDLRDGESVELDYDISHLMTGELRGTMQLDGRPLHNPPLFLVCEDATRRVQLYPEYGRLQQRVRRGTYRLEWVSGEVVREAPVVIEAGKVTQRDFDLSR